MSCTSLGTPCPHHGSQHACHGWPGGQWPRLVRAVSTTRARELLLIVSIIPCCPSAHQTRVVKRSVQRPEPNAADAGEANCQGRRVAKQSTVGTTKATTTMTMGMQWGWLVVMQWYEPGCHSLHRASAEPCLRPRAAQSSHRGAPITSHQARLRSSSRRHGPPALPTSFLRARGAWVDMRVNHSAAERALLCGR